MKGLFTQIILSLGLSLVTTTVVFAQSLDEKIGQMLMVSFEGTKTSQTSVKETLGLAKKGLIGGVILYAGNVKSPSQTKQLTSAFKQSNPKLPLFIAVDQEGGKVQRLRTKNGFKSYPSAKRVGRTQNYGDAYGTYREMACMVADAGFNWNLAPVVDLHFDNSPAIGKLNRSFSPQSNEVMAFASSFVQAHRDCGVLTSLKHYPGHGSATRDSHKDIVNVTDLWDFEEMATFEALIAADMADSIMVGHIFHFSFDEDHPASLSHTTIQKLLRGRNHYQGLVITDDLSMDAIRDNYTFAERILKAIEAGNDVLLLGPWGGNDASSAEKAHQIIEEAIKSGRISERRIDRSFKRIKALKSERL